jgi:hypothetical protein
MAFTWAECLERSSVLSCGYDGISGLGIISGYTRGVGDSEIEVMRGLRVQTIQMGITGSIRY